MKRIVTTCFLLFVILACQTVTGVTTPTGESSSMPTVELLNTPSAVIEEDMINTTSSSNSDIVFVSGSDLEIYTTDQDGNNVKKLTSLGMMLYPFPVKWSPNKKQIAYIPIIDGMYFPVYIMNSDGSEQRPVNTTIREIEPPRFEWSSDGKTIAIWGVSGFYIINSLNGGIAYHKELEKPSYYYHSATWSPDGTEVAIGTLEGILILDVAGNTIERTIDQSGIVSEIIWSPDGKKIAFSLDPPYCEDTGTFCSGIFVMNPDGSELTQLITSTDDNYRVKDWTPDGKYILFDGAGQYDTYTAFIKIEDSEIIEVSNSSGQSILSKDGKYILYGKDNKICKISTDKLSEFCFTDDVLWFDW